MLPEAGRWRQREAEREEAQVKPAGRQRNGQGKGQHKKVRKTQEER